MPSTNSNYGSKWGHSSYVDLKMPSGELCQIRKPNPQKLVTLGILDQYDKLSALIDSLHVTRVKGKPPSVSQADVEAISKDPKSIRTIIEEADRVVEYMVIQPEVRRPIRIETRLNEEMGEVEVEVRLRPHEREDGVVYTDMIDDIDKMFIFQYAAGVNPDLETFRRQFESSTEPVGDVAKVSNPPKRTTRR